MLYEKGILVSLPNPLFYYQAPLQQVLYDKTTGDPLAAGIVTYYTDSSMSTLKDVYEQSNTPSGDTIYTNIGSQLILSGIGSFVDLSGNNFIPFLLPYAGTPTDPGEFQSYFIYVTDSSGAFQFSISDWPPNEFNDSSSSIGSFTTENQITNPQFAETLFYPATTASFAVTGTATITPIAPGWFINTTGSGTVTLTQNNLTQSIITEASYSLTITVGTGISAFSIYQRIYNSPRLFATSSVAGFFAAASSTGVTLTMTYLPSTGTTATIPTTIAQGMTGFDGSYDAISGAASIEPPVNLESPSTGYVDIVITPSVVVGAFSITSVQILPVASISDVPLYSEVSVPIQKSLNSSYWLPKLAAKAIPSYLVGWDFPLNPYQAQGTGTFGTQAGVNLSYYIADQTILFQTVTSAFTTAAGPASNPGLLITASATSSFAIIQYVNPLIVQELLSQRMSVQIKCSKTNDDLVGTIGLFYTIANAAVPVLPLSLFTSITAGVPSLTTGWVAVPNTYPTQSFTVTNTASIFSFAGFDATAVSLIDTAVNFAIAITFNTMTSGDALTINYCSLVGGDIPTRPAPQSSSAVLTDCQYYYQSSFPYGTTPAAAVGSSMPGIAGIVTIAGANAQYGPSYNYPTPMRVTPTVTLFNPITAASAQIYNFSKGTNWTASTTAHSYNIQFALQGTGSSNGIVGDLIGVNFTSNARLGEV